MTFHQRTSLSLMKSHKHVPHIKRHNVQTWIYRIWHYFPGIGQQYKLCLAAHIGFSPPPSCGLPSLRCLGLGRSIIVALLRSWHLILPKDQSHTAKSLELCITDKRTALKNMFISRSVVTNRHGALHGTACPFRAKQSNIFILLGMYFSMCNEGKKNTPHL